MNDDDRNSEANRVVRDGMLARLDSDFFDGVLDYVASVRSWPFCSRCGTCSASCEPCPRCTIQLCATCRLPFFDKTPRHVCDPATLEALGAMIDEPIPGVDPKVATFTRPDLRVDAERLLGQPKKD